MNKLIFASCLLTIAACTTGSLKVTDPKTGIIAEASVNSLWSDVNLDGLTCTVGADGSRTFTVDSFGDKTSTGQESFNKMLPSLMGKLAEGAAKGAGMSIGKPPL